KILLLGHSAVFNRQDYGFGGIERTIQSIRKFLIQEGHEVRVARLVLVPNLYRDVFKENDPEAIYLDRLHLFKKMRSNLYVQKDINAILKSFQPDAVWSRSFPLSLAALDGASCPVFHIFPDLARITYLWEFSKDNSRPEI